MKKKEFQDRLEPFSNNVDRYVVGGTLKKSAMIVDDDTLSFYKRKESLPNSKKTVRDSTFFKPLFKSLKTGKSSYVAYLSDLIKNDKYIPKYVYCFVKDIRENCGDSVVYGEVVAPRLADAMGISSVYNSIVEIESQDEYDEMTDFTNILSVDFISHGQTFMDLSELNLDFDADMSLESCLLKITRALRRLANSGKINLTDENLNRFKEGFVKQYLFRNILCEDLDFSAKNCGILINEDGSFEISPMFDYEYMFYGQRVSNVYELECNAAIIYCNKHYPHILESFMKRLQQIKENGTLEDIMSNTIKVKAYTQTKARKLLNRNSKKMIESYQNIVPQKDSM